MDLRQVLQALHNADKAGDVEAARNLAKLAQQIEAAQGGVEAEEEEAPPAPKKKSGYGASLQRGAESALSSARTAVGALTGDATAAGRAGLARGADTDARLESNVGLDRVKDVYTKDGLLSAAGEAVRQVPHALAEQLPNMTATLGGARLGAMAGSVAGPAGTVIGGVAGAVAPSLLQQFGGNVQRQTQENGTVDVGKAGAAAVPQAAMDAAATFIPLGGRLVSKLTGIPANALVGRTAEQAGKLAEERLRTTLLKGGATAVAAEVPTEVAQSMLERAQAGLPLTGAEAYKEYGEVAYQAGLLAPMGAVGRMSEKGGARAQVQQQQDEARAAALASTEEGKAQEETDLAAKRQDPTYAQEVADRYKAVQAEIDQLAAAIKAPIQPGDLAGQQARADAKKRRGEILGAPETQDLVREYRAVLPVLQQLQQAAIADGGRRALAEAQNRSLMDLAEEKKQAAAAAQQRDAGIEQMQDQQQAGPMQQGDLFGQPIASELPGTEPQAPETDTLAEARKFAEQKRELEQLRVSHQQAESEAAGAGDVAKLKGLRSKRTLIENEYEFVSKQLDALGGEGQLGGVNAEAKQRELDKARAELQKLSGAGYDPAKADKLIAKIDALEQEIKGAQGGLDLGKPTRSQQVRQGPLDDQPLADAIHQGRVEALNKRAKVDDEVQGIRRLAENAKQPEMWSQARQERQSEQRTTKEIADIEQKARMDRGATEQGTLFGEPTQNRVEHGSGVKSRAVLEADLAIARAAGDRAAAERAIEGLRDLKMRAGQEQDAKAPFDTEPLNEAVGTKPSTRAKALGDLRDRREKAFAYMTQTLEKHNRGLAKREEMDKARDAVVESLLREIEIARADGLGDVERIEVRQEANQLLRDMIMRWGDTRNLINRGSKKDPDLFPAQYANGDFNTSVGGFGVGPGGMGYTNEESRAPGRQTFAKRFAAAETIREGLDELRNRFTQEGAGETTTERTLTPERVTPEALKKQLATAQSGTPARIARRIEDNWAAVSQRPELVEQASEFLYAARTGNIEAGDPDAIDAALDALEQGKRSETEQTTETVPGDKVKPKGAANEVRQQVTRPTGEVKTAVQGSLLPGAELGTIFNTQQEFDDFLGSAGLDAIRKARGLMGETLTRLTQRMEPLRAKIEGITRQIEGLQLRMQQAAAERDAAAGLSAEAKQANSRRIASLEAQMKSLAQMLEKDLAKVSDQYAVAYMKHAFTQKVVDELERRIEKGRERFESPLLGLEKRYAREIADAESKLRKGEKSHRDMLTKELPTRLRWMREIGLTPKQIAAELELGEASISKLEELAAMPEFLKGVQGKRGRSWTSDARVVSFLDEQVELHAQLATERRRLAAHAGIMRRANEALEKARAAQQADPAVIALLREQQDLLAQAQTERTELMDIAQQLVDTAHSDARAVAAEISALSNKQQLLKAIVDKTMGEAKARAKTRTAVKQETQSEREAKDGQERAAEQAKLERDADTPKTLVSFEPARRLEEARTRATKRKAAMEQQAETGATPEERAEAKAWLAAEQARVEKLTAGAEQKLQNSIANEQRIRTRIGKIEQQLEKAKTQEGKDNLNAKLEKARTDLKNAEARVSLRRGNERIAVPTRADKKAERDAQYEESLRSQMGLLGEVDSTGRLARRKIGPLTKKALQAGNMRTGDTSTSEQRTLGARNPAQQGGRAVPPTGTQAVRGAKKDTELEQALMEQQRLEGLLEKVEAALEKATEANDTPAIANRTEQKERIEKALNSAERRVNRAIAFTKLANDPSPQDIESEWDPVKLWAENEAPPVKKPGRPAPKAPPAPRAETPESIVEALGSELDEDAPFHGMTFAEAARHGAQVTNSKLVRALFMKLAETLETAPKDMQGVVYGMAYPANGNAAGFHNAKRNMVFALSPNGRTGTNKVLLHELTHAATVHALNTNPELKGKVRDLMDQAQAWLKTKEGKAYFRAHRMELGKTADGIYGFTNEKEFVAEVFANRGFQKLLTQIPSNQPKKSIFTRFVKALAEFFKGENISDTLLAEAIALSEEIMSYQRSEVYGKKVAPRVSADLDPLVMEPRYAGEWGKVGQIAGRAIASEKSFYQKVRTSGSGLVFETRLVDRFAGLERMSKVMDSLKGTQMMYYARMFDQRFHHVAQAVGVGVPQRKKLSRADGRDEYVIESTPGASLRGVMAALQPAAKKIGGADAASRVFTLYMSAQRAKSKGIQALNFDGTITQADLDETVRMVNADPVVKEALEKARREYNQYNRDLMKLLTDSGAIHKDVAAKLLKEDDYIPWYRERGGDLVIQIGSETPITLGSMKQQPHLQELIGGNKPILDFLTSSVQNTNMIIDMSLRNLATRNAVFELRDIGAATILKGTAAGPDIVQFKHEGVDKFARIETDAKGVPAALLVEGMAGIPTQPTGILKALGVPAQILRKAVTATPLYAARQLFRDSLAAPIVSGADFTPVLGALKQIGKAASNPLAARGVVGGQIFTGTQEDMSRILKRVSEGNTGWVTSLAKWEALTMEADALTRRAQYDSYRRQGLSEMEATYMALESMNFTKRGSSPSIHMANTIIPFFNAQIQGLNVLWKAATGKLPFSERLKIQEKMLSRGMLLAAASVAYAASMQDDEAYQNATPDQKYGNWFFRVPGLDEPIRIPVPFEIGYIFKALPEAIYNTMVNEHGGEEAVKAFVNIAKNTIPGGSSYLIPQAAKPLIEVGLGKSFFTGRDLLSPREARLSPEAQYRPGTSEVAKWLGQTSGISPIKIEHAVSGYTGALGLALLQALSMPIPTDESPEKAAARLSEGKLFGGAFQPNDAGGIINATYEQMLDYKQTKSTVDDLLARGEKAQALALLDGKALEYAKGQMADQFTSTMQKLAKAETAVRASNMTPDEKRAMLDKLRETKIRFAQSMRAADDRTTPP